MYVNDIKKYYEKYLMGIPTKYLVFLDKGPIGYGIYDKKNKKIWIQNKNKIYYYVVDNNLAYEKEVYKEEEMYKIIEKIKLDFNERITNEYEFSI